MRLQYQAKDRAGRMVTEEIEASSIVDARSRLREQGLFLMSIAPVGERTGIVSRPQSSNGGRVSSGELVTWMSQLTIMCQSGVALADALENLASSARRPGLRSVVSSLHRDVSSGSSLSQAMRKHPQVFQDAFIAGIAAGEQSGSLLQVLERLSALLRSERRLRNSIWALLTYPFFLCGIMGLVSTGMIFFILPQFEKVFASFGHPAPPITRLLLDVGNFARGHVIAFFGSALVAVALVVYMARRPLARQLWDLFLMNAVIIRNATRTLTCGRSFYLLGTMLQSGVPMLECLKLCRSASRSASFRDLFSGMEQELLRGHGISASLLTANFLPSGAAQMIATAESSGRLGQVLVTVGQHYEEEGENRVRNIVKLAEPVLIVCLGGIVALVVMSVMLTLFDASTMAH